MAELDALISEKVTEHRHRQTRLSMPDSDPSSPPSSSAPPVEI
ncbi:hypothetical protein [Arthrobacter sp. AFG20]